ncbi:MAG: rod shape-determining protein MreC [Treponema sp.]|nr:rod shape-determining protein MreC [Treponema sp.]
MKRKFFNFKPAEFVLTILLLFSGINLGFSSGSFVLNFKRLGFSVFSAVQKGVVAVTGAAGDFFSSIHDFINLREEYNILVEKLEDYEYMQKTSTALRIENEYLREQLDFAKKSEYKSIAAQIIARDPNALYSGITLNKGSKHGIKKGMCVLAIQNGNLGVVGKIVTVGYITSMVMPLYDNNCSISSRIQNTRDIGIVTGNGAQDNFLTLHYIRKRYIEDFNIGDIIVTSGENGNYLRDVPIGRIAEIKDIKYDNTLDIKIDPVIDFERLENVMALDLSSPLQHEEENQND